jgi:nicotinamide-nucleotide amidase
MSSAALASKAAEVLDACRKAGLKVVTVESCTGGLVAATLTEIAGSSDVVERGFVTYSNDAKMELVGVPMDLMKAHGAVSEEVARAMAAGGLAKSRADIVVSVTGIAGPGGATATKPVGLVHLACARRGGAVVHECHVFPGNRAAVRWASVDAALSLIVSLTK